MPVRGLLSFLEKFPVQESATTSETTSGHDLEEIPIDRRPHCRDSVRGVRAISFRIGERTLRTEWPIVRRRVKIAAIS